MTWSLETLRTIHIDQRRTVNNVSYKINDQNKRSAKPKMASIYEKPPLFKLQKTWNEKTILPEVYKLMSPNPRNKNLPEYLLNVLYVKSTLHDEVDNDGVQDDQEHRDKSAGLPRGPSHPQVQTTRPSAPPHRYGVCRGWGRLMKCFVFV